MPKGWLQNTVEDVSEAETPVTDCEDVKAARQAYADAVSTLAALQAEDKKFNKMMSPYVVGDGTAVDPVTLAYAKAEWPELRRRLAVAEAVKLQKERELQKVTDAARQRLTQARFAARRQLLRKVFDALDPAVKAAEALSEYDQRTQALGADAPETPFIELLPSWNGYENKIENQRKRLKEWLT